ncbi:hypothetical protein [Pyrobaculum islandicum]|uniref:hypothetical protein n=1 Tax=Pyrobaculum islandicum TaxID=2277 RepID=UPI001AE03C15|nr:hypothetical protein [Pyrobaculum islandicum]
MGGLRNGFAAVFAVSVANAAVGIASMDNARVGKLLTTATALVAAKVNNMAGTRLSTPPLRRRRGFVL